MLCLRFFSFFCCSFHYHSVETFVVTVIRLFVCSALPKRHQFSNCEGGKNHLADASGDLLLVVVRGITTQTQMSNCSGDGGLNSLVVGAVLSTLSDVCIVYYSFIYLGSPLTSVIFH